MSTLVGSDPSPAFQKSDNSLTGNGTIPSLDGLRGLSIALVILAHLQHTKAFPASLSSPWFDHGVLGVRIFFVVSGFLITRLIVQEMQRTGGLSIKLFFIRRALRILPPFYVYFAVVVLASALHWLDIPARNLLYAATYSINYVVVDGRWETGHLWSLAVEEQFYLLWPLTIRMLGLRRALLMAATVALAAPYGLLVLFLHGSRVYLLATTTFPFVFDGIAAGCLLGGYIERLRASPWFMRLISNRGGALAPLAILGLDCIDHHSRLYHAFAQLAISGGICYCVARYTSLVGSPGARLLAWRPLVWTGRRSYSLYLWQQLFLDPYQHTVLQVFPVNVVCAVACAACSYRFIERPLNELRRRYRAGRRAAPEPATNAVIARMGTDGHRPELRFFPIQPARFSILSTVSPAFWRRRPRQP
jgi:peptidoglycan/LPS O-acetylase OafA/YrhL